MSRASIKADHVSVIYPNGHKALSDINVELEPGRICGLAGVNGSGKSTLFKAIMGFVSPSQGSIAIGSLPSAQALRRNFVSYVPQSEDVDWNFPVLVEDVVMMGRYPHMGWLRIARKADKEIAAAALERMGMSAFRKRQIGELSGGQKKRVFLARALAQQAKIILLDEPFTGVDVQTETSIIGLLKELSASGHLILVSTHNLASIPEFCDDVILLNKELVAFGPAKQAFSDENLAKAFGSLLPVRKAS